MDRWTKPYYGVSHLRLRTEYEGKFQGTIVVYTSACPDMPPLVVAYVLNTQVTPFHPIDETCFRGSNLQEIIVQGKAFVERILLAYIP